MTLARERGAMTLYAITHVTDGRLRVIDFGHLSTAQECNVEECMDEEFLKLWVR